MASPASSERPAHASLSFLHSTGTFPPAFSCYTCPKGFLLLKNLGCGKHIVTLVCSLWVSTSTGGLWLCQAPWTTAGERLWWPSAACPCCHRVSLELREGCLALGDGPCKKGINYSLMMLVRVWLGRHGARPRGSLGCSSRALPEDLSLLRAGMQGMFWKLWQVQSVPSLPGDDLRVWSQGPGCSCLLWCVSPTGRGGFPSLLFPPSLCHGDCFPQRSRSQQSSGQGCGVQSLCLAAFGRGWVLPLLLWLLVDVVPGTVQNFCF